MRKRVRIGLVDNQQLFLQALAGILEREPELEVVLRAPSGDVCLKELDATQELPDILLVDLEMPELDGIQLTAEVQRKYPSVKIIILSVHYTPRLIARMIDAGCSGYLSKNCDKTELLAALSATYYKGFYIDQAVWLALRSPVPRLRNTISALTDFSDREKQVLQLICREYSSTEIAKQLFISSRTVEGHRNNLFQKTGCRNVAGLVIFAIRHHIFEFPL